MNYVGHEIYINTIENSKISHFVIDYFTERDCVAYVLFAIRKDNGFKCTLKESFSRQLLEMFLSDLLGKDIKDIKRKITSEIK